MPPHETRRFFTVYMVLLVPSFFFPFLFPLCIFTSRCTSLSSTRFLLAVGHSISALDQQQVLAGLCHMIDWLSVVSVSVAAAAAVVAVAAAVVVEPGDVEVAAQIPVVEVL